MVVANVLDLIYGFGFDLHPFQKLQFNLDVYNPNLVDVDLFAKYNETFAKLNLDNRGPKT